ncbi:hypothetical protein AAF712_006960 [Marasmius tenuissimus]|uniref:Uncharacterized protein n=1 Tax=Marasmius tenuissimus TaxID=585030 RepID=A0ABR2ZY14_9AGAR
MYQRYCRNWANFLEEICHLLGTTDHDKYAELVADPKSEKKADCNILSMTYLAFKTKHGDKGAKALLTAWCQENTLNSFGPQQGKADRHRTFDSITRQMDDFLDMCSILYEFQFWAIGAGGQILSDQSLVHIYENERNQGFGATGFMRTTEGLCGAYRAHLGKCAIDHITKEEFISLAESHGLVVSEGKPTRPTDVASSASGPSTSSIALWDVKETDIADMAKDAIVNLAHMFSTLTFLFITQPDLDFIDLVNINHNFRKKLHWKGIATQCLEQNFCIVNYPIGVTVPWLTTGTAAKKGVKGLTYPNHIKILKACSSGAVHPMQFETADAVKLQTRELLILTWAPDNSDAFYNSDNSGEPTPTPSQVSRPTCSVKESATVLSAQDDFDKLNDDSIYRLNNAINATDNDVYSSASPSKFSHKRKKTVKPTDATQVKAKGKGKEPIMDNTPKPTNHKHKGSPGAGEVANEDSGTKQAKTASGSRAADREQGTGFTSYNHINRLRKQHTSSAPSSIPIADAGFKPIVLPPPSSSTTRKATDSTARVTPAPQSCSVPRPVNTTCSTVIHPPANEPAATNIAVGTVPMPRPLLGSALDSVATTTPLAQPAQSRGATTSAATAAPV